MKSRQILVWSLVGLLSGCTSKFFFDTDNQFEDVETPHRIDLRVSLEEYVDSAQLFFFRPLGQADTLIHYEVIYDIDYLKPRQFQFELPAGKYTVYIFGNVPTACVVRKPPYTSEDVYLDYSTIRPTAVYYGLNYMNVGVDTVNTAGMLLLSSMVKLTVEKVPAQINKIVVRLLNTSSGVKMTRLLLDKAVEPPLTDTVFNVRADSSYLVVFHCLPGSGENSNSTLEVNCLDASNHIVYSGQSAPFYARPGYYMNITCVFDGVTKNVRAAGKLHFNVEEK